MDILGSLTAQPILIQFYFYIRNNLNELYYSWCCGLNEGFSMYCVCLLTA